MGAPDAPCRYAAAMIRCARIALALTGLLALSGCASATAAVSDDGVVLVVSRDSDARMQALVSGTVGVTDTGCIALDDAVLVAPEGSTISADGETVSLTGVGEFRLGDSLPGTGGGWTVWGDDGAGFGDCGSGEYAVLQPE
jgi:hypothetical protein